MNDTTMMMLRDVADEIDNHVQAADDQVSSFLWRYDSCVNGSTVVDPETLLAEGVEALVGIFARSKLLRIDLVSDPSLPLQRRLATAKLVVSCPVPVRMVAARETFAFIDEVCAHLGDRAPFQLVGELAVKSTPATAKVLRSGRAAFAARE